jgi:hypothetical protein
MSYLFGCDIDTLQPYQGCATFEVDVVLGRIPGTESLSDLIHQSYWFTVGEIEIFHRKVDSGGYLQDGGYVGSGEKVFELTFTGEDEIRSYFVRSPDRSTLRVALQKLFPLARVGR